MKKSTSKAKHAGGRPSDYTESMAEKICNEIIEGKSLRKICLQVGFPTQRTVFTWLTKHAEFLQQYTLAQNIRAENMAEEIIEIADNASKDMYEGQFGKAPNATAVRRADLKVRARMWHASKFYPKKYRDSNATELTTTDGAPVSPVHIYIPSNGREKNKTQK